MALGPLEVQASAGVKLGRLLAAGGERDAARMVLVDAARLAHPDAVSFGDGLCGTASRFTTYLAARPG